jgi:hypothetical protein
MGSYSTQVYTATFTVTPAAAAYSANDVMGTAQTLTLARR